MKATYKLVILKESSPTDVAGANSPELKFHFAVTGVVIDDIIIYQAVMTMNVPFLSESKMEIAKRHRRAEKYETKPNVCAVHMWIERSVKVWKVELQSDY